MISKYLDSNNNLVVENGIIKRVSDAEEVSQRIKTTLLFYLGEWFLNTSIGIPWLEDIFIKPANLNNIESILKSEVLNVPGVSRITDFSMSYEKSPSRKLTINMNVISTFGEINLSEVSLNV